jgi:hypothetical protein
LVHFYPLCEGRMTPPFTSSQIACASYLVSPAFRWISGPVMSRNIAGTQRAVPKSTENRGIIGPESAENHHRDRVRHAGLNVLDAIHNRSAYGTGHQRSKTIGQPRLVKLGSKWVSRGHMQGVQNAETSILPYSASMTGP